MNTKLSRRDFMKLTTTAMGGWAVSSALPSWMPRMAFAPLGVEPPGDLLVAIFQRGGMDGLNAVIPHGDPDYYHLRSQLAIAEPSASSDKTGIDLDGFFGLHPSLRPFKNLWDQKALAIVHAVGSPDPTHSHFDAMDYMERGTPGEKTIETGWIGRHLQTASWQNSSPFRAIGMGGIKQRRLYRLSLTNLRLVRPETLLGDARFAPAGSPCGRSKSPYGEVVELPCCLPGVRRAGDKQRGLYRPCRTDLRWCARRDSNSRPSGS